MLLQYSESHYIGNLTDVPNVYAGSQPDGEPLPCSFARFQLTKCFRDRRLCRGHATW